MRLFQQQKLTQVSAPVTGTPIDVQTLPARAITGQALLAMQPTAAPVYAPVNGEVRAITVTSIRLRGLNEQDYWLQLTSESGQAHFDWQVRVGDTVSPIAVLGTLSANAINASTVICNVSKSKTPRHSKLTSRLLAVVGY
ncbi:hypothetical protein [Lactiplantibacillus fabifermentans]|uniref:Uncharacterized protein n=2 Tax=Lactiplantibacillus fabifermentans TaxID=483011 RepID=A0A0R2NRG1_9LACO|nr:hypothetical protein [Lactiplantibacillus fabifermentans]ETY74022.1 hypothetical protein LFAB_09300 [Lactiplantibacillus fabifermentans T30PCM01]KRO27323.1 hypothetical protein DY78_GL000072 [Lactiplantibacillus fabifermentans DSM 21115]